MLRNGIRASGNQTWRCRLAGRERRREQQLERWHRRDGGYIRWRKNELTRQRADILARLTELDLEAILVAE